jgi:FkbM family methyltransferase
MNLLSEVYWCARGVELGALRFASKEMVMSTLAAGSTAEFGGAGCRVEAKPVAADEAVVQTRHGPICFFCPNEATRWRAETLLSKEPETLDWIDRFEPGDVYWDIGANTGPYVMYAAAAGVAGKILAFDPSAWNWWVLVEQIRRNGLSGRVLAYALALSDEAAAGVLHMRHTLAAGAGSSFGEPIGEFGERFEPVFGQAAIGIPIDELIERFGLEFPNRIKIDVDGNEERVIRGALRTLRDARVRSVAVELDSSRADLIERITGMMGDAGLRFIAKRHAAFVDESVNASIYNFEFSR